MEREKIKHFIDLNAWKEAHNLVLLVYRVTENFPNKERFGLTNQLRRAAVSLTSNIAEGFGRSTKNDKAHFYTVAKGSLFETQNQMYSAKDLGYINKEQSSIFEKQADTVSRLITGLRRAAMDRD